MVLEGLGAPRKTLPAKYFYDAEGSRLFDEICTLEAYYPTRTELGILSAHAGDVARAAGPGANFMASQVRKTMGQVLAEESPAKADVIVPVPDSGVPAAIGFSQFSGIPYELGIIRNHYVGRTFIQPTQSVRDQGVRMKHSANRSVVEGRSIVLVDDSLVRGTTSVKIVQMMRDAGAKEVHFRIASPPITHPDYYGIDTPDRDKLLAATHDLEGMRRYIGADSLAFLSVNGVYRAMGCEARDPVKPQFTDHCFTGDYPTPLTDRSSQVSSQQLSLLAEAS